MGATLVVLALAAGAFTLGTTEFAAMGLPPRFAHAFGVGAPEASRAISAYAIGVVVGAPLIAVAAARAPRGVLLVWLMGVYAAANLLSAVVPTFPLFVASRFLAGLPHGAYFGVAALVAASLARPERRAVAVSRVILGLTVATIVGVPAATMLGFWPGWRFAFVAVAVLALATASAVGFTARHAPDAGASGRSPLAELAALRRPQVWLTLGIGAIGFGGLFSVYTYLAPTLADVTRAGPAALPAALALFGLGMTGGAIVAGWLADRALMPAIAALLAWSGLADAFYSLCAGSLPLVLVAVTLVGAGGGLAAPIQVRVMKAAEGADTLAASLMPAAFNVANAIGPALGAAVLAAGAGWRATGLVGTALAAAGSLFWFALRAFSTDRRPARA